MIRVFMVQPGLRPYRVPLYERLIRDHDLRISFHAISNSNPGLKEIYRDGSNFEYETHSTVWFLGDRLSWQQARNGAQQDMYAVNPDARETPLARIESHQLKQLLGNLAPEVIAAVEQSDSTMSVRGRELWRGLACGLLGLLVVEACFATWVGRER